MKYDKIVAISQEKSKVKAEIAKQEIQNMLDRKEKVTMAALIRKTGFSKTLFYRNIEVRTALDKAYREQGACYNPKQIIVDKVMEEKLAFSSDRKWGAMEFPELGVIYVGAPERLVEKSQLPESLVDAQANGYRVLMLGVAPEQHLTEGEPKGVEPIALFEIDDPIRKNAEETLAYLHAEGVNLKVISGDNPFTVSNIARRAGLPNYDSYVDLSTMTEEKAVREAAHEYTVFGRVSPQQKKTLVNELKQSGGTVAMTGDGVNDVLALREADCSIAMAEGDGATRQIANLVLLDSDFTTLPEVLFEGRRVVNNVTKVSGIFFIKTIYSFILSILCAITAIGFPFIPIQITLIDLAIEGYPSFFLSFEQDKRKITYRYLPTALINALPNALLVVLNIIVVYILGKVLPFLLF